MVEELAHDLIISPSYSDEQVSQEQFITLDIDKDSLLTVKRKIMSSYIRNFDTIIIKGKTIANRNKDIRDIIHQLMALEIMEETPNKIVAKCFLNMKDISLSTITRKIDSIIRTMLLDLNTSIKDEKAFEDLDITKNISQRDGDVNRMSTLIARTIHYYLDNPRASWQGFDSKSLLAQWDLARNLEKIGDIIKRLARIAQELTIAQKKDLLRLLAPIEKHYIEIMTAYYKKDSEKGYELENKKRDMMNNINEFQMTHETDVKVAQAVQKVYDLFIRVNSITYLTN